MVDGSTIQKKKNLHPPLPPGRSHVVAGGLPRSTWRNALTARSSAAISFHDLARQEIQRNGGKIAKRAKNSREQ